MKSSFIVHTKQSGEFPIDPKCMHDNKLFNILDKI